jgi:hypothetical protein
MQIIKNTPDIRAWEETQHTIADAGVGFEGHGQRGQQQRGRGEGNVGDGQARDQRFIMPPLQPSIRQISSTGSHRASARRPKNRHPWISWSHADRAISCVPRSVEDRKKEEEDLTRRGVCWRRIRAPPPPSQRRPLLLLQRRRWVD